MRRKKRSQRLEEREAKALEAVEARVYEALRSEGLLIPQTEEDVARAEAALARKPVELPEALAEPPDPGALATRPRGLALKPPSFPGPRRILDDMARAAREGKPIPEEVEEVLRRDREAAERERDANDESPGTGKEA